MSIYTPSTASKQEKRFPDNYPKRITSGKGAYVYDDNSNRYLDFCCSLGPIILGHRHEEVDEEVKKTITDTGVLFSLSHPKEYELAELICEMIPSAEMVRFGHNGVDATTAAVRLARHITGREKILSFSYHGAQDIFMACTPADKGVPKCLKDTIKEFDYNEDFEIDPNDLPAAIILEPHTIRTPNSGWLELLRDNCSHYGIILIFDEIVSFPRYPGYSAQAFYGITPDLTCISKGMANGYPISAVCGKAKYMEQFKDGGVFFSTTFGGNLIGVSAALKTLEIIKRDNVPERINTLGCTLREHYKENDKMFFKGYPWRQFMECKDEKRQKIWQECIKRGIFFHVPVFFNASMTKSDMIRTADVLNEIMPTIDDVPLLGNISEVFKKR